jgi:general secretion pathway protein M
LQVLLLHNRLLRNLVVTLGPQSSISVQADMATIQLKGVNPNALTQWLVQAREQAHALPVQAKLSRKSDTSNAAWDGQIVLQLPQKP